jgi:hypothetical protein
VFSLEAPGRVSDTTILAGKFEQAMRSTMDCAYTCARAFLLHVLKCFLRAGAALRCLLEVALVFGNTLNKVFVHSAVCLFVSHIIHRVIASATPEASPSIQFCCSMKSKQAACNGFDLLTVSFHIAFHFMKNSAANLY